MKTTHEIQAEARRLTALGSRLLNEERGLTSSATAILSPRMLAQIPVSSTAPHFERHVDAVIENGALTFRLIEQDADRYHTGSSAQDAESSVVLTSTSAYEVLKNGYELVEEERLAVLLEPYADRSEDRTEPADRQTVAEVEEILGANLLGPSERIRTRAEVVEFLEGSLEPSAFITHAVERQCLRETFRERRVERHEMKLTMGEP